MAVIRRGVGVLCGALLLYLLLKPVPIEPAPWTPTPNVGLTGPYEPN
ncbi:MAG: SMP-30/gluconolactonase/LRE family protein, partial [Gemmatimonadetes bacterium]|nr:SMP-30/gluconolactonase/LRE family protein [Gemmatimonadota bacterium]